MYSGSCSLLSLSLFLSSVACGETRCTRATPLFRNFRQAFVGAVFLPIARLLILKVAGRRGGRCGQLHLGGAAFHRLAFFFFYLVTRESSNYEIMNVCNLFNREKIITTTVPRGVNGPLIQNDPFLVTFFFFNDKLTREIKVNN